MTLGCQDIIGDHLGDCLEPSLQISSRDFGKEIKNHFALKKIMNTN